jgi:N-acetylmuramoyl-L-alanine amidase
VSLLQQLLDKERRLRNASPIATDGDFGSVTQTALEAFQQRHGLAVTGVADEATWQSLERLDETNDAAPVAAAADGSTTEPSTTEGVIGALDNGIKPTHAAMQLSAASLQVLAKIVTSEAGVCSQEGKIAVAAVVLNRVRAGFADGTVKGVVSEHAQFTSYNDAAYRGKPSQDAIDAANAAAAGEDPSNGATFYYNPYLVKPDWAKGMTVLARIGTGAVNTHVFLRP